MSKRPEAAHLGNLVSDIQGALAWRGVLRIIDQYKSAVEPADKLSHLLTAMLFVLDQLEGKDAMPDVRRVVATLQAARH